MERLVGHDFELPDRGRSLRSALPTALLRRTGLEHRGCKVPSAHENDHKQATWLLAAQARQLSKSLRGGERLRMVAAKVVLFKQALPDTEHAAALRLEHRLRGNPWLAASLATLLACAAGPAPACTSLLDILQAVAVFTAGGT